MAILICDDHPLVRGALAMAAEAVCDEETALTARDFTEGWAIAERTPDLSLCIVDLHMPGATPLEGLKGLIARAPGAKIVVVTGSDDDGDMLDALALGVDGFVPKSSDASVFEAALRLVLAGGRYLPPRLASLTPGRATERVLAPAPEPADRWRAEAPLGRISGRQRDVLVQMAEGRSNKEIARDLGLSPATVKSHVAQVIAVMGATNRTEAAAKARASGLL